MHVQQVQSFMRDQGLDGWLVHDFRGGNQVFASLLPGKRWTTRRAELFIPADGPPRLAAHGIDAPALSNAGMNLELYLSWRDLHAWLMGVLRGRRRIAMEYSPEGGLPVVGIVDAGTVELVRSFGVEVASSADLIQVCLAVWPEAAAREHDRASKLVDAIKDEAFELIRQRVRTGAGVTEHEVQQHILAAFASAGLETRDPPIVAVNEHSGDPHFEVVADGGPSGAGSSIIKRGDWVLIDLWARVPGDENIHSDITWVGYVGEALQERHAKVFDAVRGARDAALELAQRSWREKKPVQGWELDEAARRVIIAAGHEQHIRHRTGHSLSTGPMVHGIGMNLDNLETRDTRLMLPGIGFTIEPGIYIPGPGGFGVRLEIDVHADPQRGPTPTSGVQTEVVRLA